MSLLEGVGEEYVHVGSIVERECLSNVLGPQACSPQGRGLLQLQEAEFGEGCVEAPAVGLGEDPDEPCKKGESDGVQDI